MGYGVGLIMAFVAGAATMFAASEHYWRRIAEILGLDRQKKPAQPQLIDEKQAEALKAGRPIKTKIERHP